VLGYYFHLGDFTRDTTGLNVTQIGVYRCLMDWCYANEKPLPLDLEEILGFLPEWRTTRARNPQLQKILVRFFVRQADGWHQTHIEREIDRHYESKPFVQAKLANNRERQRRFRDNRKRLFAALREANCIMPFSTTNEDLRAMCERLKLGNPCAYTEDATLPVTQNPVMSRVTPTGFSPPVTASTLPSSVIPSYEGGVTGVTSGRELLLSRALEVEKIVRKAGMRGASKADPRLHALLQDGVEPEAFALPVAQCIASGKGWPYLLGMVKGRHADASGSPQNGPGGDIGVFLRGLVREGSADDPGAFKGLEP
jgi:uncharacterized protein YdaU (DUF1376 family)